MKPERSGPWVAFTAGLLALCVAWSFAGPLFSAPDEPAHFLKAASVVRGQLHGVAEEQDTIDSSESGRAVKVPGAFGSATAFPICFAFEGTRDASCAPEEFVGTHDEQLISTPAGSYPPLYYLLVGWPTSAWEDANVLYVMRVVSSVVNVGFLVAGAWALAQVVGRRPAMAITLVAATPMVLYLAASVNPNGLETSAAFATWCFAMAVRRRLSRPGSVGAPLAVGLAVSGAVLANTRWLGPAFLLGILLVVACAGPLRDLVRAWRDRALSAAAIATAVSVVVAGLVILTTPNTDLLPGSPAPDGPWARFVALVGNTQAYGRNMIGQFGWADTPTPAFTYLVWLFLVGFLVGAAVLVGSSPMVRATAATVVGTLALPIVAQWPGLDEVGMVWQGRYTLPVGVGIVVLSATAVFEAGAAGRIDVARIPSILAVPALAGHLVAFWWALRRYATGTRGSLDLIGEAAWSPPGGVVIWLGLAALGAVACALAQWWASGPVTGSGEGARKSRREPGRIEVEPRA